MALDSTGEVNRNKPINNDFKEYEKTASSTFRKVSTEIQDTKSVASENILPIYSPENPLVAPENILSISEMAMLLSEFARTMKISLKSLNESSIKVMMNWNSLTVEQSKKLSVALNKRENTIQIMETDISAKLASLQYELNQMEKLGQDQQSRIEQINSKNNQDQSYREYVKELDKISGGNGEIPTDKINQANALVARFKIDIRKDDPNPYRDPVSRYFQERSREIESYNQATAVYNNQVANNNLNIQTFISENSLKEGDIPQLPLAELKNSFDMSTSDPMNATKIPNLTLPKYNNVDVKKFHEPIYNNMYDKEVSTFDNDMIQFLTFWPSIMRNTMDNLEEELSRTQLNFKSEAPLFLSSTAIGSLGMLGLTEATQTMMSRAILREILQGAAAKSNNEIAQANKESEVANVLSDQKIEAILDEFMVLSTGLLNNQSVQSLFPSLAPIANNLSSLPPNSPVYAILFADSFANRMLENISQGLTASAVQEFISNTPELASLTDEEKGQLVAGIELGQLLVAGKLISENLGLPDLLPQLLLFTFPTAEFNQTLSELPAEFKADQAERLTSIKNRFLEQGYTEEQAQKMAEVGNELNQKGLFTPSMTGNISRATIDTSMLENSITLKLIHSQFYSVNEAKDIAQEVVKSTLEEEHPSEVDFITTLESNLKKFKVKNSTEVAKAAILIPPSDRSLSQLFPYQQPVKANLESLPLSKDESTPAAPSTTPTARPPLIPMSPQELTEGIKNRLTAVLPSPQFRSQLIQQISEEFAQTFFGTPNPDAKDIAGVKSPVAMVNVLRSIVLHLKNDESVVRAALTTEAFKETLKQPPNLRFFQGIMEPSSLHAFALDQFFENPRKNLLTNLQSA